MKTKVFFYLFYISGLLGCENPIEHYSNIPNKVKKPALTYPLITQHNYSDSNIYHWLDDNNIIHYRINDITTPPEYTRIELNEFGNWLSNLPLQKPGSPVLFFNGERKSNQNASYRVIEIDIGKKDLQQCADAVMRLRAEYLFSTKNYDKIHFNYTSGHKVTFNDWSSGIKPKVLNGEVKFSLPIGTKDLSYTNFKKYLNNIFVYAGSASLQKEMKNIPPSDVQPGDVLIQGGYPGHAVIVVDLAVHKISGKKIVLLAQSYMPAQSIHVLNNLESTEISPWFNLEEPRINTPDWVFYSSDFYRFED